MNVNWLKLDRICYCSCFNHTYMSNNIHAVIRWYGAHCSGYAVRRTTLHCTAVPLSSPAPASHNNHGQCAAIPLPSPTPAKPKLVRWSLSAPDCWAFPISHNTVTQDTYTSTQRDGFQTSAFRVPKEVNVKVTTAQLQCGVFPTRLRGCAWCAL